MPALDTPLHRHMFNRFQRERAWWWRLARAWGAFQREWAASGVYGMRWGDPEVVPPLKYIRDHFLLPYVNPEHTAVEIGPGGGRWTPYLLPFRRLYLVDYLGEVLAEARRRFRRHPHVSFLLNHGDDFPGIPEGSVDFVFSFGTFVHLELDTIRSYLFHMAAILAPGGQAVLQYADQTKVMARLNPGFAHTTPDQVRAAVCAAGFEVLEEDCTSLWHSAVIRFRSRPREVHAP